MLASASQITQRDRTDDHEWPNGSAPSVVIRLQLQCRVGRSKTAAVDDWTRARRGEKAVGELLDRARRRHAAAPSPDTERELRFLENQHDIALDLLEKAKGHNGG